MAYAKNQDDQEVIFERADDAVIAHSVFPIIAQSSVKVFTDLAGILKTCDSLVEEVSDPPSDRFVQLVEFPLSAWIELNRPLWA